MRRRSSTCRSMTKGVSPISIRQPTTMLSSNVRNGRRGR
jgi:hypothetical protein